MLFPFVMLSNNITLAHCNAAGRGIHAINKAVERIKAVSLRQIRVGAG